MRSVRHDRAPNRLRPAGTPTEPRGYRVLRSLIDDRIEPSRVVTTESATEPAPEPPRTAFERHVGLVIARAGGEG